MSEMMGAPGDLSREASVARMIRVDHAGEYGAVQIYAGQLAVLGDRGNADLVRHMQEQEKRHLSTFDRLVAARRVRPSILLPLWHVAGFALGAMTAALGERAAMACTAAVEDAIDEHYGAQVTELGDDEPELRATIETFRAEELDHRETALAHEAEQAPGYQVLTALIKTGCKVAIALSERA